MENTERLKLLLEKYLHSQLSLAEMEEFNHYLADSAYEEEIKRYLGACFTEESVFTYLSSEKKESIVEHILGPVSEQGSNVRKINNLLQKITVAAILLCVGAIVFFIVKFTLTDGSIKTASTRKPDDPTGAILTLADGRIIDLAQDSIADIVNNVDLSIKKTPEGQIIYKVKDNSNTAVGFHTLRTGNGQTYRLVLPDGSVVRLNAASSITYAPNLQEKGIRKVNLTGEAFFDITKDRHHPFVVVTKGQEINVLGTRFNVSAYANDGKITTVLFSGAVTLKSGKNRITMLPGQQVLSNQGILKLAEIDTAKAAAWRSGYFRFENSDIQTVMNQLSRWYGVEIVYNSDIPKNKINGKMNRNRPLDEVITLLEASGTVKFRREGRRLIVK
jgi:hypothetical protein